MVPRLARLGAPGSPGATLEEELQIFRDEVECRARKNASLEQELAAANERADGYAATIEKQCSRIRGLERTKAEQAKLLSECEARVAGAFSERDTVQGKAEAFERRAQRAEDQLAVIKKVFSDGADALDELAAKEKREPLTYPIKADDTLSERLDSVAKMFGTGPSIKECAERLHSAFGPARDFAHDYMLCRSTPFVRPHLGAHISSDTP